MNDLVALLPATGSMDFSDFIAAARNAGLRPELWLRLKHAGELVTWIDDAGSHRVARPGNGQA